MPLFSGARVSSSGPGYIKILPGGIHVTPSPSRSRPAQTFVTSSTRGQPSFSPRAPRPLNNANCQMKHEWFEKTVRAAARVNSNLSYTLTQLNRAQATATSVEALAVVHNKLQEILSTSINSLIQIRKNLRTEFIAGIKNIRFPPKPSPQPSTSSQDDDVIFVSPTTTVPSPLISSISPSSSLSPINLPSSVSLTKRSPLVSSLNSSLQSLPSTSKDTDAPKIFLRVKSFTALQNVTSECITIPDDPLPVPPPLTPIQKPIEQITLINNSPEETNSGIMITDVTSMADEKVEEKTKNGPKEVETPTDAANGDEVQDKEPEAPADGDKLQDKEPTDAANSDEVQSKEPETSVDITNGVKVQDKIEEPITKVSDTEKKDKDDGSKNIEDVSKDNASIAFDFKDEDSLEMKKMLSTKVYLARCEEIDTRIRQTFGLVNGDASD